MNRTYSTIKLVNSENQYKLWVVWKKKNKKQQQQKENLDNNIFHLEKFLLFPSFESETSYEVWENKCYKHLIKRAFFPS